MHNLDCLFILFPNRHANEMNKLEHKVTEHELVSNLPNPFIPPAINVFAVHFCYDKKVTVNLLDTFFAFSFAVGFLVLLCKCDLTVVLLSLLLLWR